MGGLFEASRAKDLPIKSDVVVLIIRAGLCRALDSLQDIAEPLISAPVTLALADHFRTDKRVPDELPLWARGSLDWFTICSCVSSSAALMRWSRLGSG